MRSFVVGAVNTLVACYFFWAFAQWEFNPATWDSIARGSFMVMSVLGGISNYLADQEGGM